MKKHMQEITDKVRNGIRLNKEDGLFLYKEADLLDVGQLAREVKIGKTGKHVYFNVNCHINLTNICMSRCKFCAFGVDEDGHGGPYLMSPQEAFDYGSSQVDGGITEFHIVSALHPKMPFEYYLGIIERFHKAYPEIHIQAFTGVEIVYFAQISGLSVEEVLRELQAAGLGSIPGGGAEILSDEIRSVLCPKKATSDQWLEVHRIAHQLGMPSNCTMLYGHIEKIEDRIDHMIKLRDLQDEAPGFQSFIPLPFLPENTQLSDIPRTGSIDDLKTIAISRLMLDNIDHIKAFWIMQGIPIAQVALHFGADDMDGTIVEERIMHAAGAQTSKGISKQQMIKLIKETGFIPTERDTVYNILKTY